MYYSLKQKKILEKKKNTSYTGLIISIKDRMRVIGISNNPF